MLILNFKIAEYKLFKKKTDFKEIFLVKLFILLKIIHNTIVCLIELAQRELSQLIFQDFFSRIVSLL
jgi:hypothetical protein